MAASHAPTLAGLWDWVKGALQLLINRYVKFASLMHMSEF